MRKYYGSKVTSAFLVIVLIFIVMSGCKANNTSTAGQTDSIPSEQTPVYIDDNNRTNLVNGGFICEDAQFLYYKNLSDQNALYKLDKKTNEKTKLSEAFYRVATAVSNLKELVIIGVTDDKVYFVTGDPETSAADPKQGSHTALYRVGKDGKNIEKLVPDINQKCIIGNGYAYYEPKIDTKNLYRINLETKNTEIFLNGSTGLNVMNNNGDKMYYTRSEKDPAGTSLYELDMYTMNEKKLLTSSGMALGQGQGISFLNYYKDTLYYDENFIIKKYDLTYNAIETVSSRPSNETDLIYSLTVSRLGVFFITGSTLYNTEGSTPTEITKLSDNSHDFGAGLTDNYIIVTNHRTGGTKTNTINYIKAYTLKGEEVDLGF